MPELDIKYTKERIIIATMLWLMTLIILTILLGIAIYKIQKMKHV